MQIRYAQTSAEAVNYAFELIGTIPTPSKI